MGGTVHGALRSLGAPPHRAVPVRRPWGCPLRTRLPAAPRQPSLRTLLPAAGPRSRSGQSGSRRTRRHADWPGRSWEHCGEKGHVLSPRSCAGHVQEAGLQDHPGRHRRKESHTPWHRDTHPRRRTTQCSQKPAVTVSQTEMLAGGAGARQAGGRHGGRASGCPVPPRPHGGALSKGREPWVLRPAPGNDAWPWGRGRPSGRLLGRGLCLPGSALGCGDDPGRKCNQTGAGATSGPACEAAPVRSPELGGHRRRPAPALPARLPQARARPLPETRRTLLTKPHRNTDSKNLFYYRVFRENQRKH